MSALRVSHLSDARQIATGVNRALRATDPLTLSDDQATLNVDRDVAVTGSMNVTGHYSVAGVQVLGARNTGWTADTGVASKAAHATYTAGITLTYSAAYVQAEQTAMATRMDAVEAALQGATQEIKALKDALITHGPIGA